MIVIFSALLLRVLAPWFPGVRGLTLFPFIILHPGIRGTAEERCTINHERIHIRQQAELLLVVFAVWYLASFIAGRFRGLGKDAAYRGIIFEREAFDRMYEDDYLSRRGWFAFMRYRRKRGRREGPPPSRGTGGPAASAGG
jgi:hypothetical protein